MAVTVGGCPDRWDEPSLDTNAIIDASHGVRTMAGVSDLSKATAVLGSVFGVLVVLAGLLILFGVVSAGAAIGAELGSATLGAIGALAAVALVLAPVVLLVIATANRRDTGIPEPTESGADELSKLKAQYAAGEIDEPTLERRLDALLAARHGDADSTTPSEPTEEPLTEEDQ